MSARGLFRTWDDIRATLEGLEAKGDGPALKVRRDLASQIVRQAEEQGKSVPAWVAAATQTSPRLRAFDERQAAESEVRRLDAQLTAIKRQTQELRQRRAERIVMAAVRSGAIHPERREEVLRDFEHDPDRLGAEFEPEFQSAETDEAFARRFAEQFGVAPEGMTVPQREPDEEAKEIAREFGLRPEEVI